jgi:hypothetical protein
MALCVKRERKKRNYGCKDYTGHPKTTRIHETYDFIENRRMLIDS